MTSAPVPFNDLKRGTESIRTELDAAIARVVSSGWFVLGPEHDALESELAAYVGTSHAINVGNGTDALELGLAALGVASGSLVLTVANAGAYTSTAARLLGAEPVYVDVDPETHLMSAATLEAALEQCGDVPAAIVVTHLYGALAPMDEILAVAARHNIPVLEDCAQSLGARANGTMGGAFGHIATTSFYPTKNLGALGDGGAVMTNSDELAARVRQMRQYGWASKYSIEAAHGRNSRLDEMQAAILRIKLPLLDAGNQRRRDIHAVYEAAVTAGSQATQLRLVNHANERFIAHLAVLESDDHEGARSALHAAGVKTDVHYPIPDHKQKWPDFTPRHMPLDVTDRVAERIFSVPMFPELTDAEVARIADGLSAL